MDTVSPQKFAIRVFMTKGAFLEVNLSEFVVQEFEEAVPPGWVRQDVIEARVEPVDPGSIDAAYANYEICITGKIIPNVLDESFEE